MNTGSSNAGVITSEVRDGVGIITLNRPERLNAWALGMGKIYFDILEKLAKAPEVRVILLRGAGRAFCAGADMSGLSTLAGGEDSASYRDPRPYWLPLSIGKPIIGAIQGPCIGFGVALMLCCDIRFVAEDLKLHLVYAKRGLVAELGMTWLLPRLVGAGVALELLLSARSIGAQEAASIGLASRVVAPEELFDTTFAYCAEMAATCAPTSLSIMKRQLYTDLMNNLDTAYDRSEADLRLALASADFAEGVQAFKEKRTPKYPPLDPSLAFYNFDES